MGDLKKLYRSRYSSLILVFAMVVLFSAGLAKGGQRVALVIGNSAYQHTPLKNPVNDAHDIGNVLKNLHFKVDVQKNVDKRQMIAAVYRFADKLKKADIGFFFYAGHGMQVNGVNFLIPLGTDVRSSGDIEYEAVHVGRILSKMEEAGNSLNLVVLDACRNNPYRGLFRSDEKGLARMDAPVGSLIAYATSPGSVAHDGNGRNGMFTKHLLSALKKPNLTVRDVFDEAGLGVMNETNRGQVPWVHSSPMRPIYLAGGNPQEVSTPSNYKQTFDTGSLKVTSDPSGAYVGLNGKDSGKTPLQLGNLPIGAIDVSVRLSGYSSEKQSIAIKKGRKRVVHFDLEKESTSGWLSIQKSPSHAKVRILNIGPSYHDGIELVKGKYHVEVSASGYKTEKRWIDLDVGEDLLIDFSLSRQHKVVTPTVSAQNSSPTKLTSRSFTDPTTGMQFIFVKGGCYQMGSNKGESDERPVHKVCVDSFYIGKYEVTQGEYQKTMGNNPSSFKKGDRFPVEKVSWRDAQEFIRKLNSRSGRTFKLPTEAQWEYAARSGGKDQEYSGGNDVGSVAWYNENSGDTTHRVGTKRANGLGIYDMSGNVWEWTSDWYGKDYYSKSPVNNPEGPGSGEFRAFRGGSWFSGPAGVRSANRSGRSPWWRSSDLGFRLALQDQN